MNINFLSVLFIESDIKTLQFLFVSSVFLIIGFHFFDLYMDYISKYRKIKVGRTYIKSDTLSRKIEIEKKSFGKIYYIDLDGRYHDTMSYVEFVDDKYKLYE